MINPILDKVFTQGLCLIHENFDKECKGKKNFEGKNKKFKLLNNFYKLFYIKIK